MLSSSTEWEKKSFRRSSALLLYPRHVSLPCWFSPSQNKAICIQKII